MTQVNTIIDFLAIPRELKERIRDFVIANNDEKESCKEMSVFVSYLSPSLLREVVNFDFYEVLYDL